MEIKFSNTPAWLNKNAFPFALLLLGAVFVIISGVNIKDISKFDIERLQDVLWPVFVLGLVIIAGSVVLFLNPSWHMKLTTPKTDESSILFYQDRDELPTLQEQLKGAQELWLILFTGSVVNAAHLYDHFFKNRQVKLILPDPFYPAFKDLCELFVQNFERMQFDLITLTEKATGDGAEVLWYQGPIGTGVVLADPNNDQPWMRMEILVPFGKTDERPSIRVSTKGASRLVPRMKESFIKMWKASVKPYKQIPSSSTS